MSEPQADFFNNAPIDIDRIPLDDESRARWPQALVDMHEVVVAALRDRDDAEVLGGEVVRALAHYFGGREWYLPKGDKLEIALRDRTIWREFNGRNLYELAAKHKLSDRMVALIIAQQRALHRKKIQPSLF